METASLTRRLGELGHRPGVGPGGLPLIVPTSAEQAAELLGTCTGEGWRVRLQGAGTRSPAAAAADLIVSAAALQGFDIYQPDDLTVGIRAGTNHGVAARLLAEHQQLLLLDTPGPPAATVGGSFATGEAGPLRAGYGTPRDLALGVNLVTGDGRLLRLGGQVVKNVAGYDLVRLVVGSRGTLGLIAQVHVRLRSLPPSDVSIIASVEDVTTAARAALPLRDAVAPAALELLTPTAELRSWHLAIRLHGSPEATAAALALVRQHLPAAATLPPDQAPGFWHNLAAAEAEASIRVRCMVLPSALPDLVSAAARLLNIGSDNEFNTWRGAAHGTEGILRLWRSEPAAAAPADLATTLAELKDVAVSLNGTCICDRGPEAVRALQLGHTAGSRVLELERELRRRFDPGAILVGA